MDWGFGVWLRLIWPSWESGCDGLWGMKRLWRRVVAAKYGLGKEEWCTDRVRESHG